MTLLTKLRHAFSSLTVQSAAPMPSAAPKPSFVDKRTQRIFEALPFLEDPRKKIALLVSEYFLLPPCQEATQSIFEALFFSEDPRKKITLLVSEYSLLYPCQEATQKCHTFLAQQAETALFQQEPVSLKRTLSSSGNHQKLVPVIQELSSLIGATNVLSFNTSCINITNAGKFAEVLYNTPHETLECVGEDQQQALTALFQHLQGMPPVALFGRLKWLSAPSTCFGHPAMEALLSKMQQLTTLTVTFYKPEKLSPNAFDGFTRRYPKVSLLQLLHCPYLPHELKKMFSQRLDPMIHRISCIVTKGNGRTLHYTAAIFRGVRATRMHCDQRSITFMREQEILFDWNPSNAPLHALLHATPRGRTKLPDCSVITTFTVEQLLCFATKYLQRGTLRYTEQIALLNQIIEWAERNPHHIAQHKEDFEAVIETARDRQLPLFDEKAAKLLELQRTAATSWNDLQQKMQMMISSSFKQQTYKQILLNNSPLSPTEIETIARSVAIPEISHIHITITAGRTYTLNYAMQIERKVHSHSLYAHSYALTLKRKLGITFQWAEAAFPHLTEPFKVHQGPAQFHSYNVSHNMPHTIFLFFINEQLASKRLTSSEQLALLEATRVWVARNPHEVTTLQKELRDIVGIALKKQQAHFTKSANALRNASKLFAARD